MIDRSTQSKPKEVPAGPRSHFGPKHLVWRKQVNAVDWKEEYVRCPASSFTHCSLPSSIMTADPRRAGQKRSAALDSPVSESSARKLPRLDAASDEVPNGAATPVSESAGEEVSSTQSRASSVARLEKHPVVSRTGSTELPRHSSPASHQSAISSANETRKVDKHAFAMTIPFEQLLEKSSDLGAARVKLDIAQSDYDHMIQLHESRTDQSVEFPSVQEQLDKEKGAIEKGLQQARESYDTLKTELTEQVGLASNNAAMQCEDSANRIIRLEAENGRLQQDFQMLRRAVTKDFEEMKSQFKLQLQTSQKPIMDRKQIVEVVEEKLAWESGARVSLESTLTGNLAKVLHEVDGWKNKFAKRSATADQKAEDARTQIEVVERKVQQLETTLTEQSKKVEDAKSILANLQTSIASLLGKDAAAGQRHKTCLNMIADLETTVNEKLEVAEKREAERANFPAPTTVADNHDASKIATLACKIDQLEKNVASGEELAELRILLDEVVKYSEETRQETTSEIVRLDKEVDNWSDKIKLLQYQIKDVNHPAAPDRGDDESIATLRVQVDALKDAQQQQHNAHEALQASVLEQSSLRKNASDTSDKAKVQELIDKHDAQTNTTQELQRQLDTCRQTLDLTTNRTTQSFREIAQRFREVNAQLSTTNPPRVGADVLPKDRTATPSQVQPTATTQPSETLQLRTEVNRMHTRLDELVISMNSNNKEVRSRHANHKDQLTQCKSDIQKALEKADSAHALVEGYRQATAAVERDLASRAQELVDVMERTDALEDTKMKVSAALSDMTDMKNGIRVCRDNIKRLEAMSEGQQAKLRGTEEKVEAIASRMDDEEKRQETMNTWMNTMDDLEISNALHELEDRLTGARDSTGISLSVVHEAITKIESSLGHSKTNFEAEEKELQELWQLSAEEDMGTT